MLSGKTAVVTGSGRGIGKGIALELAKNGAKIVVVDVLEREGSNTVKEIENSGGKAIYLKTDITDEYEVDKMIDSCIKAFGSLDILVNNAGVVSTKGVLDLTTSDFEKVMNVNVKGVFLCSKAALGYMKEKQSGKIISIASVAGKRGGGLMGTSLYSASKGAVIAFTKSIAREAGRYGINVNAITPAMTETDMIKDLDDSMRSEILKSVPLGRPGQPKDIAMAVCFLASGMSDYITGEIMDVDGGLMCD